MRLATRWLPRSLFEDLREEISAPLVNAQELELTHCLNWYEIVASKCEGEVRDLVDPAILSKKERGFEDRPA